MAVPGARFPPPPTETSYMRVAALLRAEILAGEIALGSWLRMSAIADRCGVSVQPVREALQQLEGEGLVEMIPNRGARVRELSRQRMIHNHEIGEALETFMSRRFAEEASLSDLRQLEALQRVHDVALEGDDWLAIDDANFAFHRHINGHGGNEEAVDLVTRYYGLTQAIHSTLGRAEGYKARVRAEHHALIDAFRQRDGELAARIGASHVRGTLNDVLSLFDASQPEPARRRR